LNELPVASVGGIGQMIFHKW